MDEEAVLGMQACKQEKSHFVNYLLPLPVLSGDFNGQPF